MSLTGDRLRQVREMGYTEPGSARRSSGMDVARGN